MYHVTILDGPAETPVTLDEVKIQLRRVGQTHEDAYINALILAATERLQDYTRRTFINTRYQIDYDAVKVANRTEVYPFVKLKRAPLISVETVQLMRNSVYVDEAFQLKDQASYARVLFQNYLSSGALDDVPFPLRIVFRAGYADAAAVPESIKEAIKRYINYLYNNRGDCTPECGNALPLDVKVMINSFRILDTFG